MKICSKCKIEKDESAFYPRKDRRCGVSPRCKICMTEYYRSDEYKQINKKRRESENFQSWKEKYHRTINYKITNTKTRQKYRSTERGKLNAKLAKIRRRDLERQLDANLTIEDIKFIFARFNNKCFNCDSEQDLCLDHNYPLLNGYGLSLSNAVVLCRSCNSSKGDKTPEEFYSEVKIRHLFSLLI